MAQELFQEYPDSRPADRIRRHPPSGRSFLKYAFNSDILTSGCGGCNRSARKNHPDGAACRGVMSGTHHLLALRHRPVPCRKPRSRIAVPGLLRFPAQVPAVDPDRANLHMYRPGLSACHKTVQDPPSLFPSTRASPLPLRRAGRYVPPTESAGRPRLQAACCKKRNWSGSGDKNRRQAVRT